MDRRGWIPTEVRFEFRIPNVEDGDGALILNTNDDTARFELPPGVPAFLNEASHCAGDAIQKWGIGILAGLTFVGGVLAYRKHRRSGYVAFAAAGLTGVGGWWMRRTLNSLPEWLSHPIPMHQVELLEHDDKGLTIYVNGGGLRKLSLALGPEDYDTLLVSSVQEFLKLARESPQGEETDAEDRF